MILYKCNKCLVGLFSAIGAAYTNKQLDIVICSNEIIQLGYDVSIIPDDTEIAKRIRKSINNISKKIYRNITVAYRHNHQNKENIIFDYIKLLFKYKSEIVDEMLNLDTVIAFNKLIHEVNQDAHRMLEFIRFMETENEIYYGYFSHTHDVLELIMPHFAARYNILKFVLHDIDRNIAAIYNGGYTLTVLDKVSINITENEQLYSTLWRSYFQHLSIAERQNYKLQAQHVPHRYRHFMTEF